MNPLATGQAHARCGLKRQRARQEAADLQTRRMAKMTTAEAPAAARLAHGIGSRDALPGVPNDHLFDALHKAGDNMRVVHTRHEQGAAYMALGAALATDRPQGYAVVPGPGLLNTGAALLTAYSMSAPVLALIGQIPDADIGRGVGHLHEIRDQAGIIARLVDFSAKIDGPADAPRLVSEALRAMRTGRPGPAALECAIDVWGKAGEVALVPPFPTEAPAIDEDALAAAAKIIGEAKRPLIIAGGGAKGASEEVTALSVMLQAPVMGYRRGRGVLSSRDPLSVTLPLARELWGEAGVVVGIGTHLFYPLREWGFDDELQIVRIDADPEEPAWSKKPAAIVTGDAKAVLKRLLDLAPRHNRARPLRKEEEQERQGKM